MKQSFPFKRCQRLTKKSDFLRMYKEGRKRTAGPLLIHIRRNQHAYSRLGLSVPKRVGNAVQRNRIKRRCREAFRLMTHDDQCGVDILLTMRPHLAYSTAEYGVLLRESLTG